MPATRTPKDSWVDEGLRALGAGGPDAVRVEALARALKVTKGGFYWHFADRQALLDEMLDAWERVVIDDVVAAVEAGGGDAREKLRRLFTMASSMSKRWLLPVELAVRDWARRDAAVARRLRRVDNRRMDYMRGLFAEFCPDADDVEARCVLVMSLFIGVHFIAADYGPTRSRAQAVELAVAHLLR